jgi:hypothetical protein
LRAKLDEVWLFFEGKATRTMTLGHTPTVKIC